MPGISERDSASDQVPFRATLTLDLWVWQRDRAAGVLEQIVQAVEKLATNDQGGVTVHHRVKSVFLERSGLEG